MARYRKNHDLRTRSKRKALETGRYQWQKTGTKGVMLGYRRGARGNGTWFVKYSWLDGKDEQKRLGEDERKRPGNYGQERLGEADDSQDANGETVLSFAQAIEKAKEKATAARNINANFTVGRAVERYLAWFKDNRRSYGRTVKAADAHIPKTLRDIRTADLTTKILREWLEDLAKKPARLRSLKDKQKFREENDPRARKATANRVFAILRAALNKAWREDYITSDAAWRRVQPFHGVAVASVRFLSEDECKRLVNACKPDFRRLVQAALFVGARFGELRQTEVSDFLPDAGTLFLRHTKNGKPRHIPLNEPGLRFFESLVVGRTEGPIFLRSDGEAWKPPQQARRMRNACLTAKVPEISFHELRDSYASNLLRAGVSLEIVSELLGHTDTRITRKHYGHLAPSHVADMVWDKLPNLGGEPVETNVTPITQTRKKQGA